MLVLQMVEEYRRWLQPQPLHITISKRVTAHELVTWFGPAVGTSVNAESLIRLHERLGN
jgi:hypothetical protein